MPVATATPAMITIVSLGATGKIESLNGDAADDSEEPPVAGCVVECSAERAVNQCPSSLSHSPMRPTWSASR